MSSGRESREGEATNGVLLALGANIGDPIRQLRRAVDELEEVVHILALSHVYLTEPVGIKEQPDFYNIVVAGSTTATVYELHAFSRGIEKGLGRGAHEANAPRPIDIDLLAFGELVLTTPDLVLPHPRLHLRTFVLVPLAQVAPAWRHPLLEATASEMLEALREPTAVSHWGELVEGGQEG